MESLEKAIENVKSMASDSLSGDTSALEISLRKIGLITTGLRHAHLSKESALNLSIQLNSLVREVRSEKLGAIASILKVIDASKNVLFEYQVIQSCYNRTPAASIESEASMKTSDSPEKPVHVVVEMPPVLSTDHSDGPTSVSDVPISAKRKRITPDYLVSSSSSNVISEVESSSSSYEPSGGSDIAGPSGLQTQSLQDLNDKEAKKNLPGISASLASSLSTSDESGRPKRLAAIKASTKSELSKQRMEAMKSKREVDRLEKLLKKISDKITYHQGAELSLDDMDLPNSSYVMVDKLQKKFMEVVKHLYNKHGHRSVLLGRPTDRVVAYENSDIPAVNDEINLFLKKRIFPDFIDIRNCVVKANQSHSLQLGKARINEIAKSAFLTIGNHIKLMRKRDNVKNFGSVYTDQCHPSNDPAYMDQDLNRQLKLQKESGEKKLDVLFDEFSHRQDEDRQGADKEIDNERKGLDEDDSNVVVVVEDDEEEEEDDEDEDEEDDEEEEVEDADFEEMEGSSAAEQEDQQEVNGVKEVDENVSTQVEVFMDVPESPQIDLVEPDPSVEKATNIEDVAAEMMA